MKNHALSVFASGSHCGVLSRSAVEEQTFLFTYDAACAGHHAVSLTMPVQPDQYDSVGTVLARKVAVFISPEHAMDAA